MSIASVASYVWGNCTYYVARTLNWVPAGLGNASNWLANAQKKGLRTSSTPKAGDVVVYGPGHGYDPKYGHVAVVQSVQGPNAFTVSEMNFKGLGITDTRHSTMQGVMGFIEPPNSTQQASSGSASGQNPLAAFLLGLAGYAGQTAKTGTSTVANLTFPGGTFSVSNPFQGLMDNWWRGVLILFGFVIIVVGIVILFHQQITEAQEQVTSTAKTAGETAAVAG